MLEFILLVIVLLFVKAGEYFVGYFKPFVNAAEYIVGYCLAVTEGWSIFCYLLSCH